MSGKRRDARTCGLPACRKADQRRRAEDLPQPEADQRGTNLDALTAWLDTIDTAPAPLVAAAKALAAELDRAPRQSALWGRYLDALGRILEHGDGKPDDDLEVLLAQLRGAR